MVRIIRGHMKTHSQQDESMCTLCLAKSYEDLDATFDLKASMSFRTGS